MSEPVMEKHYSVEAVWDPEVGVYYAKSNVPGLNVETTTIEEFIEVVKDLAPELIRANEPAAKTHRRSVRLHADLELAIA